MTPIEPARDFLREYEQELAVCAMRYRGELAAIAARYSRMHKGADLELAGGVEWLGDLMSRVIVVYGEGGQAKCQQWTQALAAHVARPIEDHVLLIATAGVHVQ